MTTTDTTTTTTSTSSATATTPRRAPWRVPAPIPVVCHSKVPKRILQWLDQQWAAGRTVTVETRTGRRSYLWTPGRARHQSLAGGTPFWTDENDRLWMAHGRTALPVPPSWRFTATAPRPRTRRPKPGAAARTTPPAPQALQAGTDPAGAEPAPSTEPAAGAEPEDTA